MVSLGQAGVDAREQALYRLGGQRDAEVEQRVRRVVHHASHLDRKLQQEGQSMGCFGGPELSICPGQIVEVTCMARWFPVSTSHR